MPLGKGLPADDAKIDAMNDDYLLRYSRQIMLPGIDIDGQQTLLDSRVLLVGLGGLGSPVSMYLAASGIGHMVLTDHDHVDLANLQRQIVHTTASIGEPKVESAVKTLSAINPDVKFTTFAHKLQGDELLEQVELADVVVDATDNFAARFALNNACLDTATPLVAGAAIRMEGQVSVYRLDDPESPCFECLYPASTELDERCADTGVLGPVVGIIGCIEATETIKLLLKTGETLASRLLLLDARTMQWQEMKLPKNPNCGACGTVVDTKKTG